MAGHKQVWDHSRMGTGGRFLVPLLAITALCLDYSPARAQTIECVGTESSPSLLTSCGTATKYAYKVTAGSNTIDTVYIATEDGNASNYTNICKPAGWTFSVHVISPTPHFTPYDHRPATAHAGVTASTGLCGFMIEFRGESQPIAPFTSYTFGFDHAGPPHDVEWRLSGGNYTDWAQPVGGGLGPVHAPDSTCKRDSISLNSGQGVSFGGADPNWVVITDPAHVAGHPTATVIQSFVWGNPEPNSQWIAAHFNDNTFTAPGGYTEFQYCFCLDSVLLNPALQIGIRVDNSAEVFLNGALILSVQGASPWQPPPTSTTITTKSSFMAGKNCIVVKVWNEAATPTGVNIVGWVTQDHRPGVGPGDCCDSCIYCYADGDIDGDGIVLTVADYVALTGYLRGTGPAPEPLCRADLNGDGFIDDGDAEVLDCYFVHGVSCLPSYPLRTICHPDTVRGACCELDTCHVRSQYNCELRSGVYFGDGTACSEQYCWGQVCGSKFEDLNHNGIQDLGEPPMAGVTVTFTPAVPGVQNPVVTDANGLWCFGPMPAGPYTIFETVPPGMVQTAPPTGYFDVNVLPQLGIEGGAFGNADSCVGPKSTTIQLAGIKDNFVSPTEPSSPSTSLSATYTCPAGALDQFDIGLFEQCLGHTFAGFKSPGCLVDKATLCFKIEGREQPSGTISFLENAGSGLVPIWSFPIGSLDPNPPFNWFDVFEVCLNLSALPPGTGNGATNVLAALQDGTLDVKIEGDSILVDYLELTVQSCCPCIPPPDSMVLWLPLDGNANDIKGGNHGSVIGSGTFVPAVVDQGFKGVSGSLVKVNDAPNLDITNLTLDAWVRVDAITPGRNMAIIWKGDPAGASITTPYAISISGTTSPATGTPGCVFATITNGVTPQYIHSLNPIPVGTGTFTHVAVTADGSTLLLYVNGVQANASQVQAVIPYANTRAVQIGGADIPSNSHLDGVVDEVEIFNRALSQSEIEAIYNAGPSGKCKCDCPHQGDINGDGVIDVFDVIAAIGIAFSGDPDAQDPSCPRSRGDLNGDGVVDVFDVIYLIGTAFGGGPEPVNPCNP